MSELSALVAVFGAIDDYVVQHPEIEPDVAQLLCPYRDGASGWFQPFRAWQAALATAQRVEDDARVPDLAAALFELGTAAMQDRMSRNVSRRLLGLTAVARFMPSYRPDEDGWDATVAAVVAPNITGGDQADEVLRLLADVTVLPDISLWTTTLEELVDEGLLAPDAVQPAPCSGRLVLADVAGHPHPAAAIRSSFCVAGLPFDRVARFLDPARWPDCSDFWCDMDPRPDPVPGVQRFLETVSLECDRIDPVTIKTCLDFRRFSMPGLSVLAYRLSDDQASCGGDGEILVDEGSVEVRQLDGRVCVTTTKRVLFRYAFTPGWIAGMVCPLGYADMGTQLVYNCAADQPTRPVKREPGREPECLTWIDEGAALLQRCVEDYAAFVSGASRKAMAGSYSSEDLARYATGAWKRACGDAGKIVGIGLGAARAAGRAPRRISVSERRAAP